MWKFIIKLWPFAWASTVADFDHWRESFWREQAMRLRSERLANLQRHDMGVLSDKLFAAQETAAELDRELREVRRLSERRRKVLKSIRDAFPN